MLRATMIDEPEGQWCIESTALNVPWRSCRRTAWRSVGAGNGGVGTPGERAFAPARTLNKSASPCAHAVKRGCQQVVTRDFWAERRACAYLADVNVRTGAGSGRRDGARRELPPF